MSTLLDTNTLLRSTQPNHPLRQAAADAIAVFRAQGEQLCLVPQNLYEYWVVCTRPLVANVIIWVFLQGRWKSSADGCGLPRLSCYLMERL